MRTTFLKEMSKTALQVAAAKLKSENLTVLVRIEIDVYEKFKLLSYWTAPLPPKKQRRILFIT